MTDQNSQFFAILTAIGEAKQANASALGIPWTFAQMGVGDANGTEPIPNPAQSKLINERRRAPLNQVKIDPANANVIIAEQIIPENVGGWWVRELGLYDTDGDMVAVANCAPTYKPLLTQGSGRTQVIRINLIVSSTANIELKIDPSVVLATREYVDTVVVAALSKLDYKHSVVAATTANIVLSGTQTLDGELLPPGARVLVKDQTQAKDNGIYVISASGVWKRAQDADISAEVTPGLFTTVEKGLVNGDSVWQLTTDAPIAVGNTALVFEKVAGRTGVAAGAYTKVTVDREGRVIGGTTPTSLAGYSIEAATEEDALAQADHDNTKPMTALRVWQAMSKRMVQATEAAFGWAKVATQTQMNSGADDTVFVTPKKMCFGFAVLFAINGFIAFPFWLGGFVFQWGRITITQPDLNTTTAGNWVFPMQFPVRCLSAWSHQHVLGGPGNSILERLSGSGDPALNGATFVISDSDGPGDYILRTFAIGH